MPSPPSAVANPGLDRDRARVATSLPVPLPSPASPEIPVSSIPAVNVASVPQRSPLRYPGGKTWLIPHIRSWLASRSAPPVLFEPFCGGATVSLTAAAEALAHRCILAEIDRDVAAFWHAALTHADELCDRITCFNPTRENVAKISTDVPTTLVEHGFRTFVLNRTRRGGILARGASLSRIGENGKGVASRWYAKTLVKRLRELNAYADRLVFCEADGMKMLESIALIENVVMFIDPPYTAGGKRAGKRLYAHHEIDHERLFAVLADSDVDFLMTYDMAPEIIELVNRHGFTAVRVAMKNTHHARLNELVVTRRPVFAPAQPDTA